ncbi:MAG: DUF1304 domain-containing protein [Bacteroidota bacterium]|nr:DUF1304 domain-containing protein [Bacteroidota bacterium]
MEVIKSALIAIVVLEHIFFLWLEMFAWETAGKKAFKGALPTEMFKPTKTLAANQGLYNGFLAAGLIWTFFIDDKNWQTNISMFFLICIIIAGIYGGFTASKKIFIIQALPALLALVFILFT